MDGRSALLTLWGERAEQLSMVLGATYTIMAVKAANEFKGQRAYNSTPSTSFKVNNHTLMVFYLLNLLNYFYIQSQMVLIFQNHLLKFFMQNVHIRLI